MAKSKQKKGARKGKSPALGNPCFVCSLRDKMLKDAIAAPATLALIGYELGYIHATTSIMLYQRQADPDLSQLSKFFCQTHGKAVASRVAVDLNEPPLQPCHLCHKLAAFLAVVDQQDPHGTLYATGFIDGVGALMVHRIQADDFDCTKLRRSFCEPHSKQLVLHVGEVVGWNNASLALLPDGLRLQ